MKKFTEYLEKSETVTEAFQLDRATHTRMIGLATTKDLEQFFKLAKSLKTELKDEGFDGGRCC